MAWDGWNSRHGRGLQREDIEEPQRLHKHCHNLAHNAGTQVCFSPDSGTEAAPSGSAGVETCAVPVPVLSCFLVDQPPRLQPPLLLVVLKSIKHVQPVGWGAGQSSSDPGHNIQPLPTV